MLGAAWRLLFGQLATYSHKDASMTPPDQAGERRINPSLRALFEDARRVTAPFFAPAQGWGGKPLTMYAQQALRENFPDLAPQDLAILTAAVQRFHAASQGK
jgi:hypothetical protein